MPRFLDFVQFDNALHNQAFPLLDALAANDNLRDRSLTRFERDDPPPYAESTESEELEDGPLPPLRRELLEELDDAPLPPLYRKLPEELQSIMDQPICSSELEGYGLEKTLQPGNVYHKEARLDQSRVLSSRYRRMGMFSGTDGTQREGVLVRHNIKRRWEQLGVWNLEWGFPGRCVQPNDDVSRWKWPWQHHEVDGYAPGDLYTQQLIVRALHLRQNLHRGESCPVIPRSHLRKDAPASEAESFIISRPWFIFWVEVVEERVRYLRLSEEDRRSYPYSAQTQVIKWWKERGDWRKDFDEIGRVTSWKWRHESPSPEPEDFEPPKSPEDIPVDIVNTDIDFTPSEIGDLDTIRLPRSEQPPGFWTIEAGSLGLQTFPGQTKEVVEARKSVQQIHSPSPSNRVRLFPLVPSPSPPNWVFFVPSDPSLSREHGDTPPESPRPHPPQNSQLSNRNADNYPPPRRSARIAGLKRPAEPLPSETAPNKKLEGRAAPKAAVPITQHTTRKTRRTRAGPVQLPLPSQTAPNKKLKGRAAPKAGAPRAAVPVTQRTTRRLAT